MLRSNQRLCVWSGIVGVVFWAVGFWLFAGFVPPPSPMRSAVEVAAMYESRRNAIRVGLLLACLGSAFFTPYFAVISVQLRRIEGRLAPLAWAQLGLAAILCLEFIYPSMILEVAAFRGNRTVAEIQLLNDVGWILFIGTTTTGLAQWVVIGIAILRDTREDPILPHWAGYLSIWTGVLFFPGCLCVFFKDGPLAWNGVFTWWIPATAFVVWMSAMTYVLLRVIGKQGDEGVKESRDETSVLVSEMSTLRAQTEAMRQELVELRERISVQ